MLAAAEDHSEGQFKASLSGYNEVPSIASPGSGQVTLSVSSDQKSLSVTLNFAQLAGVAQSAGLYFGLPATMGGLIAPICGGTKATCPTTAAGTVTVTLAATDIAAIMAQGLTAGDIASVIHAIANGAVYVNVLTNKFANGEIRGQLGRGFGLGQGVGGGRGN
jgi:hypothetical protein